MSGLSIEKISMRFDLPGGGHVQALKDVSLDLKAGDLLSVLGPSGCGKTTLLNIVAGFLAPTEGQINLNGNRVTGPDAERGMVFQQGALFEWMSVRDNVGFGPSMKGMPSEEKKEITTAMVMLNDRLGNPGKNKTSLANSERQTEGFSAKCLAVGDINLTLFLSSFFSACSFL